MPLAPLHGMAVLRAERDMLTPEAFARELEAHRGVLLTLASAVLGRRGEADDALQDASTIALGKLGSFEEGTNFAAWMGQIVRYVALNHARRRAGRELVAPERLDTLWREPPQPEEPADARNLCVLSLDQEHFDDEVLAALAELAPVARACLLLRAVQDLDYSELSRMLGIPEGTAMSHVHRARAALRAALAARQARGGRS